jgi:2-oxoglutarate ferredoxin oxidoreductase subunit beta
MKFRIPEAILDTNTGWCSGCGHGTVVRLLAEVADDLGLSQNIIVVMDVACGAFIESTVTYNYIGAAHGRPMITAAGVKRVRKKDIVVAHAGDGSAYAIGMESTIHTALRNENILAIVINNCVFGMTGGQMSPTSLIGQKTTSSPLGRLPETSGQPFDVVKTLQNFDIAYLARGSVHKPSEVNRLKRMIKKAIEKQMCGEGFCLVEVLSPCPTNWGISTLDSIKKIEDEIIPVFDLGEFIDAGGKQND